MRIIQRPQLSVEQIPDQAGQRRIRVSYELVTSGPGDHPETTEVTERIVVHGIDQNDALIEPSTAPLVTRESAYAAAAGSVERVFEEDVSRDQLDVGRDWWSTALDGQVQPIAEWVDHLVAEIFITIDGQVLDTTKTNVVTGSWGALGSD